jgi:hypothetical protein
MTHTILFYSEDGPAAKARAAEMRDKDKIVRPIHSVVVSELLHCDAFEFMPDVPADERDRIAALFGVTVSTGPSTIEKVMIGADEYRAQHRGKGRWYVMRGDEIISGPYAKEDVEAAVEREKAIA